MAKLFDEANRHILFIQVLALLVGVCFTSPVLQISENRPRRSSPEGNAVCIHSGLERKKVQFKFTLFVAGFDNRLVFSICIATCVYYFNMNVHQGVVTYVSRVEAFATGIKIESSDQSPFSGRSRPPNY